MRSFERALVLSYENFQKPIIELFEIAPKAPKSPVTFIFRILHVVAISRFKTWCFSIFSFLFLSGNSVVTRHRHIDSLHSYIEWACCMRMAVITMVTNLPFTNARRLDRDLQINFTEDDNYGGKKRSLERRRK